MAVVQPIPSPVLPHLRRHGHQTPTCKYWKAGRCNRHPCKFLHSEAAVAPDAKNSKVWVNPACVTASVAKRSKVWVNPDCAARRPVAKRQLCRDDEVKLLSRSSANAGAPAPRPDPEPADDGARKTAVSKEFVAGSCSREESCPDLHAWCVSDSFGAVARLQGHTKAITGIGLPEGSDKLVSGSLDSTVRVWDCLTGQCVQVVTMEDGEVGSLICSGPWVFIGVPNAVKAFHTQSAKELRLRGPRAQVGSLLAEDELFAGTEDGTIYVWKINQEQQCFDEVTMLTGHAKAVVSLTQGCMGLFSGSVDGNIRVWDLKSYTCIHNLAGHTSAVTSLLCWHDYLFSSSHDGLVKVWQSRPAADETELEVYYTHSEDQGVLVLQGTFDAQKKPVLMVSCSNGTVHVYDLPSLKERGQIYSKDKVTTISLGAGGLNFTGDGSGEIGVVRWGSGH